jgi:ADP-heptose:LPS heptosyltransferase
MKNKKTAGRSGAAGKLKGRTPVKGNAATASIDVKFDCRHFRGHVPCAPNKLRAKVCGSCDEYERVTKRVLIIKLGAIGDVIRTTPLVTAFRRRYPGCRVTWVTHSPDVLPRDLVDEVRRPDAVGLYTVLRGSYDVAVNLDKEAEACLLLADVKAGKKLGFTWKDGHIAPATPAARHKMLTGLFDSLSQENTKNYLEEIFEVCGMEFSGEEYLIRRDPDAEARWKKAAAAQSGGRKVVGLNTGCGKRWTTRLWPSDYWIALIVRLQEAGHFPLLMGGPDEDALNKEYARRTGAWYPGHFPLAEFIALSSAADVVVTQVSMMMHIAIALRAPLVLMNNIFNAREFELYGRGVIVGPSTGCDCYYGESCSRARHCMLDLGVDRVFDEISRLAGGRR